MKNLINFDNDYFLVPFITVTTAVIITGSYVAKLCYELYDIINILNTSCIKFDTHGLNLKNYSMELEYIVLNNEKIHYMLEEDISSIPWSDTNFNICVNLCKNNNNYGCYCKQLIHSKIKSDIYLKMWVESYGYKIPHIDYINRYNNIIDTHHFFQKQVNDIDKLNKYDVVWYYKNFPNVFNKYNTFSNKYLIDYYKYFQKSM